MPLVQSNSNHDESGSDITTLSVTLTGVTAGNLVAVAIKYQDIGTTTTTVSDGTALTAATEVAHSEPGFVRWFYRLSETAGSHTYTLTLGSGRPYVRIMALEYASPAGAFTLATQGGSFGTSAAVTSGNITTSGDALVLAVYGERDGPTFSSPQVNGAAADGSFNSNGYATVWHRRVTSGFTGAATGTLSFSAEWMCAAIAFNIAAGGGVTATEARFTSDPPTSIDTGASFGCAVSLTDSGGSVDTSKTGNVTITMSSGTGTLSGTTVVAASSGVATFSGLSIDTAGAKVLTAAYTGLTSDTHNITVTTPSSGQPTAKRHGGVQGTINTAAWRGMW